MAGLVAGGIVLILNAGVNWLLGRLLSGFRPPEWWQVWLLTAGPLILGIPLITMTANETTLPAGLALWVTLVALMGLALALLPGRMAAGLSAAFFRLRIWLERKR